MPVYLLAFLPEPIWENRWKGRTAAILYEHNWARFPLLRCVYARLIMKPSLNVFGDDN